MALQAIPQASSPHSEATSAAGNSEKIARNTVWYGIDVVFSLVTAFATSIAIARAIGPEKLGYFNYILSLTTIGATLGGVGIPATAGKYMAEYFGRGESAIARAIFSAALRLQLAFAGVITAAGLALTFTVSDRAYWASSALLVASVLPGMLTFVLARANMAAENMRANVPSSIASGCVYIVGTISSLVFGWGLPAIAASWFLSRSLEVVMRLFTVRKWMRTIAPAPLPAEVRSRMLNFSGWSTLLMVVQLIVWDRSDVFLLKWLSPNISEVTFFSVAFNLTQRVLLIPQAFGTAIGASVLAQYGRDKNALGSMVSRAGRYMFLCGLPCLLGMTVLSGPIMRTLYGSQYLAVIPVLAISAIFALPKTMLAPAMQLMQAAESQKSLFWWITLCGVVNMAIDVALIPSHGAYGAAIGNGAGQALAVFGIWFLAHRKFQLTFHFGDLTRILLSGAGMGIAVLACNQVTSGWSSLVVGVAAGGITFIVLLRVFKVLNPEDGDRFQRLVLKVPRPFRNWGERLLIQLCGPIAAPSRPV
jgi:O-antigen/teichoic acid export membrane protein